MMFSRGIRSSVVVTAAASAAFIAFGVPASAQPGSVDILPPGFPCIHTNVYPLPLLEWGWGPLDGAPPRYAAEAGASGMGYLDLYTPANGVTNYFHPGINTPLSALLGANSLGFLHRGATAFQLRIRGADRPDDVSGFTTLVWEPAYNNNEGAQNWFFSGDLARGNWWSTRDIAGQPAGAAAGNYRTIEEIADANPRAFVTEYGVNVGRTNVASQGAADDITYGCARWDFEPVPSGS